MAFPKSFTPCTHSWKIQADAVVCEKCGKREDTGYTQTGSEWRKRELRCKLGIHDRSLMTYLFGMAHRCGLCGIMVDRGGPFGGNAGE